MFSYNTCIFHFITNRECHFIEQKRNNEGIVRSPRTSYSTANMPATIKERANA